MFKLIQKLIKETLIAFYIKQNKFIVQKKVVKGNKVLSHENFEFEEEEFISFINSCFIDNTQTYISTVIDTFNQGSVDSCAHSKYKELGINIDNIKILCLKNYSIFIGLYELNQFQKEMKKYKVDFVFSPYLLIDMNKKSLKNSLYFLIADNFATIVVYEDGNKPKYSNIYQLKIEEKEENITEEDDELVNDDIDDIDDLVDDIEEIESLDDTLDDVEAIDDIDDIENIDEVGIDGGSKIQEEILDVKNEIELMDFLKNSIKDYYESYSDNFLEHIFLFYTEELSDNFITNIKNETFLEIEKSEIDILDEINKLALKDINV